MEEADLGEANYKFTDAQGNTLIKDIGGLKPKSAPVPAAAPPPAPKAPVSKAARSPSDLLDAIEAVQRKEVSVLKAMVELLIEKGVFTREEYLARVKR
jgi:hypothetical protein